MLRDLGSRDTEFIGVVREIRRELLALGGVEDRGYEAILMQGSGTFALESVISSTVPPDGKMLVVVNGAYGRRIEQIARLLRIAYRRARLAGETEAPDPARSRPRWNAIRPLRTSPWSTAKPPPASSTRSRRLARLPGDSTAATSSTP